MAFRRASALLLPRLVAVAPAFEAATATLAARRSPAMAALAVRSLHTSAPAAKLVDVLRREAEYERSNYEKTEEVSMGPPNGYKLEEKAGDCLLKLVKEQNGEKITVEVMANEPAEEIPLEDENGQEIISSAVGFTVLVSKPGFDDALVFACATNTDEPTLAVESATLEPAEGEPEDSAYVGPIYEELDPELIGEFDSYLRDRGVDETLAGYIAAIAADKEQREYVDWLERVRKFTA